MVPRAEAKRYLPAEDTFLLGDALKDFSGESCLEIGFGSGVVLARTAERFKLAVGTDIIGLSEARKAKAPRVELVLTDGASGFRDRVFDLVFFNPPYLPSENVEDRAVDGGRGGVEVPILFLKHALRVMKADGTMVALLSDGGDLDSFASYCSSQGLKIEEIARKKLFYESLVVFAIKRREKRVRARRC